MQQQLCFVNQDTTSYMCCRWDRSNRFLRCYPATANQKKGDDQCCDNPLGKPSRQQARRAAYFSQYGNCAFPIMLTELKAFRNSFPTSHQSWCKRSVASFLQRNPCRNMVSHSSGHHLTNEMDPFPIIPTGAAALCQHLCDIVCHGSMRWRTSQWASSIFAAFHALMSSTMKEHWGATENRELSSTPLKSDGSGHQCRKDKAAQHAWTAADPLKISSGGRAHKMRNEFEWHTHQLECNSDFSAWEWTFWCPWTRRAF